jgi:hypothetical protein
MVRPEIGSAVVRYVIALTVLHEFDCYEGHSTFYSPNVGAERGVNASHHIEGAERTRKMHPFMEAK